jgi:DNA-binding NtrC family response regulator
VTPGSGQEAEEPLVLVVDDSASEREVMRDLLGMEGYEVRVASHGAEALKMVEDLPVRLVITDLHMPGVGGMEVLDRLRARDRDLPVIMFTGDGSLPVGMKAMARGAFYFLEKPVRGEHLLPLVERAIGSQRPVPAAG